MVHPDVYTKRQIRGILIFDDVENGRLSRTHTQFSKLSLSQSSCAGHNKIERLQNGCNGKQHHFSWLCNFLGAGCHTLFFRSIVSTLGSLLKEEIPGQTHLFGVLPIELHGSKINVKEPFRKGLLLMSKYHFGQIRISRLVRFRSCFVDGLCFNGVPQNEMSLLWQEHWLYFSQLTQEIHYSIDSGNVLQHLALFFHWKCYSLGFLRCRSHLKLARLFFIQILLCRSGLTTPTAYNIRDTCGTLGASLKLIILRKLELTCWNLFGGLDCSID